MSKRDWLWIHDCVAVDPSKDRFDWIWWAPGMPTEEREERYPEGISTRKPGMPSHYIRCREDIAEDLQREWLPRFLEREPKFYVPID